MKATLSSGIYRLAFYVALSGWAILAIYSFVVFDLEEFFGSFVKHFLSTEHEGLKFRALVLFGPLITTVLGFLLFERSRQGRQLEQLIQTVEELSYRDQLTGLFNRRYVESALQKEIEKVKRYGNRLSCLVLDIDKFKDINDRFGHAAGDYVLREFADIVTKCVRGADIVARWGGEEFIVLLPHTGSEHAMLPAHRIKETVRSYRFAEIPGHHITVSIGVSSCGMETNTLETLFKSADQAMYRAKRKGGNGVAVVEEKAGPGETE